MTASSPHAVHLPPQHHPPQPPASWEDLANSVIAAELVYKSVDIGHDAATQLLSTYRSSYFAPTTVTIQSLQWSPQASAQRYMLASSADTLYVAFMGTKQARDFVTNALCWQEAFFEDAFAAACGKLPTCATPTVHSGFRKRASSVPIMDIWKQARAAGKRLVLTGHSLGGSVAQVCALTLLRSVPEARSNNLLHCVSYATPAIGNSALQRAVEASGWDKLFINIALPEDVVPHLLSWTPPPRKTTPQRSARRPTHVQTTQLMTTTLFSILLQSLLPQSSAAAAITAPLRAFAQHTSELSGLIRMLPLAGAVAMPFLLPANILWSAGLFACYVGIACLKSTIRLGPQHYYMIGRQYLVGADGALRSGNKDGVDGGGESDNMSVWLHGCSGGKHPAPVGPRRPRSWLARVQWHYAMHRMPPLRTRLQAAQSFCAGGADDTIGAFLLCG